MLMYLQKAVFSFEKFLNGQNRYSSGSHHPIKNSKISDFPHPLMVAGKPLVIYATIIYVLDVTMWRS